VSSPEPPRVDAHQHVWDPARAEYPWLTPDLGVLDRRYDGSEIAVERRAAGIDRTVLVQAADNLDDSENMFRVAAADPGIAGVVVWVPLADPAAAAAVLDSWHDRPVVGVRHLIHREPDPDWLLRPEVGAGLDLLAERGLAFDVCAETPQLLAHVPALAAAHPTLRLVVDHLGKPPIREGRRRPWSDLLTAAAAAPTVSAKLSGLNTAAGPGWSAADFRPWVEHALSAFGADRLMYGSDWPFGLLAADSYTQLYEGLSGTLDRLSEPERAAVMGGTATRVYRLDQG
jgi:L-fuconolactonase